MMMHQQGGERKTMGAVATTRVFSPVSCPRYVEDPQGAVQGGDSSRKVLVGAAAGLRYTAAVVCADEAGGTAPLHSAPRLNPQSSHKQPPENTWT